MNTWRIAEDISKYLKNETLGAVVWKPWNAFIFDSITDFVSTLRDESRPVPTRIANWPSRTDSDRTPHLRLFLFVLLLDSSAEALLSLCIASTS